MINDHTMAEAHFALMRDCSSMDSTVAERLRATVGMSLGWADQTLDVLIQLDDDLQAFEATASRQMQSLSRAEIAQQTEQSVQRLRDGVRTVMMSMQYQDVIGQAVERAAAALEKRAAAIGKVVEGSELSCRHTGEIAEIAEIAEIHRAYRTEDNLHRAIGSDKEEYHEEYNVAA